MLTLSQSTRNQIRCHAEEAYPEESCGMLLGIINGDTREMREAVRCRNVHPSPQTNYEIDLRDVIRVQREARKRGLEIVGFYHSHPDHPASPSPTDIADAYWIGYSYVITNVDHGTAGETNSFLLSGTKYENRAFVGEGIVFTS